MAVSRMARPFFLAATVAVVISVALVAQSAKPSGAKMAEAANAFLGTLPPELRKKATFDYGDPHREAWYFTPQQDKQKNFTRKGVRMEEMNAEQKTAAIAILKSGLSTKGYEQATTIMSLEGILRDFEGTAGAMTRNPNWYFVSIFGEPTNTGKWGWRLEGHHMSINFTLEKGEVVSASPVLFGSNPAEVKSGAKKGLRTLPEIEDLAKELIQSLNDMQVKTAKQAKQLPEIKEGQADAAVGEMVGIPSKSLTPEQQATLWKLVEAYANRLPSDVAADELKRVKDAGVGNVYFAFAGDTAPGKGYTYRVHGPSFVVEFLNLQADGQKNPANHIHSSWRRLPKDFVK